MGRSVELSKNHRCDVTWLRRTGSGTALFLALLASSTATAQRTAESAVAAAQDAFGTSVGRESIGLYTPTDVRGFSPVQAGNVRIDGLYFDRQADLNSRLVSGSAMRVSAGALTLPFPAPTGVAEYFLRLPGAKPLVSTVVGVGPYDKVFAEFDAQIPLAGERLGLAAGGGVTLNDYWYWGGDATFWQGSLLLRWRPSETVEVLPFWSRADREGWDTVPSIVPAPGVVPPRVERHKFFGQQWADWSVYETNAGVIGRARPDDALLLRGGIFVSQTYKSRMFSDLFLNTREDGSADHQFVAYPGQRDVSWSGELRASRRFSEGDRRHLLHLTARGRAVRHLFGGADVRTLGRANIGVAAPFTRPIFLDGLRTRDRARQLTAGLGYELHWPQVADLSLGLQKTGYRKRVLLPGQPVTRVAAGPLLGNAALSVRLPADFQAYVGFARGLEEPGTAPNNAINRGEPMAASRTRQFDASLRRQFGTALLASVGVFDITKPYFNLDPNGRFGPQGRVRHRGAELSLRGTFDGLSVVAGAVLLKARIVSPLVAAGRIGAVPLGRFPRVFRGGLEYAPVGWSGFSIDGQLELLSARVASVDNRVHVPGIGTLTLGARYRFPLWGRRASLRGQLFNVTNSYNWNITSTGTFSYSDPRRITVQLALDL